MEKNGQEFVLDHRFVHSSLLFLFNRKVHVWSPHPDNLHRPRFQRNPGDIFRHLLLPRPWSTTRNLLGKIHPGLPALFHGLPTGSHRHRQNPNFEK